MKKNRYLFGILTAVLLFGGVAVLSGFAQEKDEDAAADVEKADDEPAEENGEDAAEADEEKVVEDGAEVAKPIGALFDQLGAETARERIAAQKELIQLLADADHRQRIVDLAVELYSESDDPEVWHRVREVLKSYVSVHSDFGPRRGFLGVMMGLVEYPDEKGEIRRAVRVETVVPDTPAAKANLLVGDLILKINDLDLDTPYGDLSFYRFTFLQKAGTAVKLTILRNWKLIEVDAVLMSRPVEMFVNQQREQKSPDELLRGWLEENKIEPR